MGLDMNLFGRKTVMDWSVDRPMEDGFPVAARTLELGYWRKHPNLHGYIVDNFADGVDECQEIYLYEDDLEDIIQAVQDDLLPYTEGFFFGVSPTKDQPEYNEQKQEDIAILKKALDWLRENSNNKESRSVIYQASW